MEQGSLGACSEGPQWGMGQSARKFLGSLKTQKTVSLHRKNNFFLYHIKLNSSLMYAAILKYVSEIIK